MSTSSHSISLGLIGIRGYGKKFIELTKSHPNARFESCFHRDENIAKEYSLLLNIPRFHTDLDKFLNDPQIEVVVLAVPNQFHFDLAKKALIAGKHVWIEKPMTHTSEEAIELISLAQSKNLVLMVGHNHRENGHIKAIKTQLQNNLIGKIVAAEFNMSHGGGMKFGPEKWRYHKEFCPGGPFNMLGTHLIDTANFLFGNAKNISGTIQKLHAPTTSEDMSLVHVQYENGVIASIINLYNSVSTEFINIYGTEGAIRYQRWPESKLYFQPKDTKFEADPYTEIPFIETNSQLELFKKFIQIIYDNKPELSNAQDALAVIKLFEKIIKQNNKPEALL